MAWNTSNPFTLRGIQTIGFWRFLAIFFALLNLKHIPFGWHLRILTGLITHLSRRSRLPLPLSQPSRPSTLFQPLVISSRAQLLECDYNMHKSNSTYFSDFDIARLHLLTRLISPGLVLTAKNLYREANNTGPKRLGIYLGAVSCNFRREIKPYEAFDMWTRILCWDRKWIYVITHFMRKGTVEPTTWMLQPWKNSKPRIRAADRGTSDENKKPRTFATGIAKYVIKRGRLTVPPERVLRDSGLLPPQPEASSSIISATAESDTPPEETASAISPAAAAATTVQDLTPDHAAFTASKSSNDDDWDHEHIERERQRGMQIMEAWNQTEALHEERLGDDVALGRYWDIP
ncbi:MAG: hypothetical protein Q9174_003803 [Haloplaca sp. 1 TL-2023]